MAQIKQKTAAQTSHQAPPQTPPQTSFAPEVSQDSRASRTQLDDLLSRTFNSILRVEEKSISNRITTGLTITEVHTIAAVGLYEQNPMNVVASRLGVTLATLTVTVSKLELKGYLKRNRSETDRRKVLLELTKRGKQVYRVHSLFHQRMVDEALSDLSPDEERVLTSALIKVKEFFDTQH